MLVVLAVAVHFAALAYIIGGGFLALRWRRSIWLHLVFVAWGGCIVTMPWLVCPLTFGENWARRHAGMPTIPEGFVNHYIQGVMYPAAWTPLVQVMGGVVIITSWAMWFAARRHGRVPVHKHET
jgi:hypothetical protein